MVKPKGRSNHTSAVPIDQPRKSSALNYDGAKLLRVIFSCISKAESLRRITIDGVRIPVEVLESLGRALATCPSEYGIRSLALKGSPIGDEGLRIITPYIAKSKLRLLYLDRYGCNLLL